MVRDDFESDVTELEARQEAYLRQEMELNEQLRESLDKLKVGHPCEGDPEFDAWRQERDTWRKLAAGDAAMGTSESILAASNVDSFEKHPDCETVKDTGEHVKQAAELFGSAKRSWEIADDNAVADEWREKLQNEITSLRGDAAFLREQGDWLRNEATRLQSEVMDERDGLLHDPDRQHELRVVENYAYRLNTIIRSLER